MKKWLSRSEELASKAEQEDDWPARAGLILRVPETRLKRARKHSYFLSSRHLRAASRQ